MIIYIDNDCKCHVSAADGLRAVETELFDDKCDEFIQGYRYVPQGESWTRSDGVVFNGEMIAPWKDYAELDVAQRAYEREQLADMQAALNALGVNVNG